MVVTLRGIHEAVPSAVSQDDLWELFFADHYGRDRLAERIWRHAGVERRHGAVIPFKEDVTEWGTGARMQRFREEAELLGREALTGCLADAGLDPTDVDVLTVVTCTGYGTPGLDVGLSRELGLRPDVHRLQLGHMGCFAALPGLQTVADAVRLRGGVGVLLSIELCSLHVQPPTNAIDQIVAHALFADAAAAAVVAPGVPGLELIDVASVTDVEAASMMTWDITDRGFRMSLSPDVPRVLERHVAAVVGDLLAAHGLSVGDVRGWAIHPGGPRVVDTVADRLHLDENDVEDSRKVLREFGNCSSATVLLVLQRLLARRALEQGDPVVCLAFGPGLTLAAALLRSR